MYAHASLIPGKVETNGFVRAPFIMWSAPLTTGCESYYLCRTSNLRQVYHASRGINWEWEVVKIGAEMDACCQVCVSYFLRVLLSVKSCPQCCFRHLQRREADECVRHDHESDNIH